VWKYKNVDAGDEMDVHQMLAETHAAVITDVQAVKADVAELKALLSAIAAKVGA
jgi:hypothetical protein